MGYKSMNAEKLIRIFKRWLDGQKISSISDHECCDRKTVRQYIRRLIAKGYQQGQTDLARDHLLREVQEMLELNRRKGQKTNPFMKYHDEISLYINGGEKHERVKPKTAFEIITQKYSEVASYTTFKRYIKEQELGKTKETIRIELPPGQEVQIDYGQVGRMPNDQGKNKTVWAFCGILSHSRLPFVQFTFKQDTQSFVESHVQMWEFYGGSTSRINIDNLKSGVIRPDLIDPDFNHAYREMADHYGSFIDPSRVRRAQDKGKVERFVPTARELFRKFRRLHPDLDIEGLNKKAKEWCFGVYGTRVHGTTKVRPVEVFDNIEKKTLNALPKERFCVPVWKECKVHPDQFIQFEKKCYSLPPEYRGVYVWVRRSGKIVQIYHSCRLIRQYLVPQKYRAYDKNDFPKVKQEMMEGGYGKYLIKQAMELGGGSDVLIRQILAPHAYLNSRRAQGIIGVLKKYRHLNEFAVIVEKAVRLRIFKSDELTELFEKESRQLTLPIDEVPVSHEGAAMARPANYYFSDNSE